jgi:hypothetical protein
VALLVLLPLAVLSGFGAFLVGSGPVAVVVGAHAVVGFAILLLLPWKSMIARRGLRRRRPGQLTSLSLAVLVVLALLTGLLHSIGALRDVNGYGVLLIHVGAGLLAIVPAVLHIRRRRIRPRLTDVNRRAVLRGGLLSAAAVGVYLSAEGLARAFSLPGAGRRATGSYELSSGDPAGVPATSWMFDSVPPVDTASWRLTVMLSDGERSFTLSDIDAMHDQVVAVLDCTGGWWSEQTWTGARVARLLPPGSTGTVTVISATGYRRRLPLSDDLLLATGCSGQRLSAGHGAPVRLVVPGRRGFHWVKWVMRIEHDEHPWWWEPPLPLQ